jgi:protoporphyrinogen oxidase
MDSAIIIGAGPAGLAAAYELARQNRPPLVLEKAGQVGGIARTETYKDYRFDIGGHRFFTKNDEILRLWQEMLGADLRQAPRLSRILHDGRLFHYPISLFNVLTNLGVGESLLVLSSYLSARLRPRPEEHSIEEWLVNRFGDRLYRTFFKSYTEKVWGIPCRDIQADWARQRIRGLSLPTAVANAILGNTNRVKSLIGEFYYPARGSGMMWQRFREAVENCGGQVHLDSEVVRLRREGGRIRAVVVRRDGETTEIAGQQFISSMPLRELLTRLDPPPPDEIVRAANGLAHRAFIVVGLILDRPDLFADNWIYVHDPRVQMGRIQNLGNWSAEMLPDPRRSSLGLEYFCSEGDALWTMPDAALVELAVRELSVLGLAGDCTVLDSVVFRQPQAYPVYNRDYARNLDVIRSFMSTLDNLQTIGRNGMHRYNNMDHSVLTGILAARNLLGENNVVWNVNADGFYQE